MNDAFVGTWRVHPHMDEILQYDDDWVTSELGRPLSLSLPFTSGNQPHRGDAVRAYFENLLPDSQAIRTRIARRFQADSTQAFALLAEVGRDCAGALQILPDDAPPQGIQEVRATSLDNASAARVLRNALTSAPLDGRAPDDDDFRISIAGAQEKTGLLWFDGQWHLPHGATPTSHILKLPLGLVGNFRLNMSESVENEWLCSRILHAYGLPTARTQIVQFEDMKALAVERFDRRWWEGKQGNRWLLRLPQEDLCQATGTPPHLKYESDGGPGIRTIMELLTTSSNPDHDKRTFFQAQVLFWMLRATDGHAKNFSIFLRPRGAYALAPLYDVLSAYPVIGTGANQLSPFKAKMAMAVRSKNAHWTMRDIARRHWATVGAAHGIITPDGRGVEGVLDEMVARTPEVVHAVRAQVPDGFPAQVADSILTGLQTAAEKLAN